MCTVIKNCNIIIIFYPRVLMFICFFLFQSLKKIIDLTKLFHYTGWPRENATLTINNLKKKRDRMKKLCA